METIIFMNNIDKNIDFELRRLTRKYNSFEALRDKAVSVKCEDPERQDDFMVWKYLKSAGHDLLDEKVKKIRKRDNNSLKEPIGEKSGDESIMDATIDESNDIKVEVSKISIFSEFLIFETFDIYQAISPKRMEIMDYININEPNSVKELATGLGRDYKNVYDDVLALSKFGLVNLIKIGRNKTPVTRVDHVQAVPRKY
jgi:predicted transcriptional regulator